MTSVVIVVFDGLQPSQVNPELMPNLSALAASGVTFTNHYPVFLPMTRANVAEVVTWRTPGGDGLPRKRCKSASPNASAQRPDQPLTSFSFHPFVTPQTSLAH